jgi:hypothetical protein
MNEIIEILMRRDSISRIEAENLVEECKEELWDAAARGSYQECEDELRVYKEKIVGEILNKTPNKLIESRYYEDALSEYDFASHDIISFEKKLEIEHKHFKLED